MKTPIGAGAAASVTPGRYRISLAGSAHEVDVVELSPDPWPSRRTVLMSQFVGECRFPLAVSQLQSWGAEFSQL